MDTERLKKITESTLEGLAKRELKLSVIVGKSEEAKERRLIPEVVEGFFIDAAPLAGISPQELKNQEHVYQVGRGWKVESVQDENRGFDLISRKPHPEDPQTAIRVRFIEVKGRSHIGEVALTTNEFKTAERLKKDFWLYVVFNCANDPEIHIIQDPARLGWKPVVRVEHYHVGANEILQSGIENVQIPKTFD